MSQIPPEFLSRLSGDAEATTRFAGLSDPEKDEVLSRARRARSMEDMDNIISRL